MRFASIGRPGILDIASQMTQKEHRTGAILAAALSLHAFAAAAACPSGAVSCEDFEQGTRLQPAAGAAPLVRTQAGSANRLLLLRGDSRPLLLPALTSR